MSFRLIDLTNEKIRTHGSVGILTGDSKITTLRDRKESRTEFRLVSVYSKQNGRIELKVVRFRGNYSNGHRRGGIR